MRTVVTALLVLAFTGCLDAQAPAPTPAPVEPAAPPDAYSYRPDGRRDPFQNLMGAGAEPQAGVRKADGPASFRVEEISVRGIMRSGVTHVAMVQGPDNKTYLIHQGEKLADGLVKAVTSEGLVIVQDVNDPLSLQKRREVRKVLRSLEDAKE